MGIGVFDVAAAGDDEQRLASRALQDKIAAATYDVRERHGQWLFGAHDLDGFNDRAKLAYVDICRTIEPHVHARKGVYRKVMKTMEREWRQRQAAQTEDTMAQVADQSIANSQLGKGMPKPPPPIKMHTRQPQLIGYRQAGTDSYETPEHTWEGKGPSRNPDGSPRRDSTQSEIEHMQGVGKALHGRRHQACWPGCHEDEAHAKKYHKDSDEKEARRHEAVQPHYQDDIRRVMDFADGPSERELQYLGEPSDPHLLDVHPSHHATRRQADGPPVHQDPDRAHRVTDQLHQKIDEHAQHNHDVADQLHQKIDERSQPMGTPGLLGAPEGPRGPVGGFGGPDPYGDPMGGDPYAGDPIDDLMQSPLGQHFQEQGPTFGRSVEQMDQFPRHAYRQAAEDGAYERHAPDHPELDTDVTYHEHQGEELKPEGNFDVYKDRVDQGAPEKIDHNFTEPDSRNTSTSEVTRHDKDGDHNFVPTVTGARMYSEYQRIARMLQAGPGDDPSMAAPGGPAIPDVSTPGAGASGVASAAPNVGPTTPPTSTSTPPAGAGPAQPMMPMASREYQQISAMLRRATPEPPPTPPVGGAQTPVVDVINSLGDPGEVGPQFQRGGSKWALKQIREVGTKEARLRLVAVARSRGVLTDKEAARVHTLITRKVADSNYLQKADEALTKVLNEKAEEFQNTIAPLQQALITIQQAEQMANPLNVSPPAGTVNVLPGQQGAGQAAQAASGGGVGMGVQPAAAGLAGQPATQAMQQTARRRRARGEGYPNGPSEALHERQRTHSPVDEAEVSEEDYNNAVMNAFGRDIPRKRGGRGKA